MNLITKLYHLYFYVFYSEYRILYKYCDITYADSTKSTYNTNYNSYYCYNGNEVMFTSNNKNYEFKYFWTLRDLVIYFNKKTKIKFSISSCINNMPMHNFINIDKNFIKHLFIVKPIVTNKQLEASKIVKKRLNKLSKVNG